MAAAPNFELVGFATLDGLGQKGTTGGAAGPLVRVSTLGELVSSLQTNVPLRIELLNDLDLSPLANHSGGFPAGYPTGEILVNSNKTLYSKHGATIRRGTLRIGKGPNGKQNIVIRNLRCRDLWVFDSSGQYDTYGWDFISIESGSHHVWVDHCDFEQAYDGMLDIKGGSDFVTVSWNIFRNQKKGNLVGHSDSSTAAKVDRGHLNVTFHHNWYERVDERMPRMRFGNAHVFNLYCSDLAGRGIQSTTEAATLVENVYFFHPRSGSRPTVEENGGPTGTVKVVNSTIVNLPGVNVAFRQFGESDFMFHTPFAGPVPPYPYSLDATATVPAVVTNYAGVGKIGFALWQSEQFNVEQLGDEEISGVEADPDGDRLSNFQEFVAGTAPLDAASALRVTSLARREDDLILTWSTAGPRTNAVQVAAGTRAGFADVSSPVVISASGDTVTNLVLAGEATNPAARYYRVRVTP